MKKLFVAITVLALAAGVAHAEGKRSRAKGTIPGIAQGVGRTFTTAGGNTVQYGKQALRILGKGARKTVNQVIDAGQCARRSKHPGSLVACGVDMGGGILAVIWKTGTYEGGNAVYFVGSIVGDWGRVWRDAFDACSDQLGAIAGAPCRVVSIVFDAAGKIVKITAYAVGDTLVYTGRNGAKLIKHVVGIPASLLRLKPERAIKETFQAVKWTLCTGVDLVLVVPRVLGGLFGEEIDSACD